MSQASSHTQNRVKQFEAEEEDEPIHDKTIQHQLSGGEDDNISKVGEKRKAKESVDAFVGAVVKEENAESVMA